MKRVSASASVMPADIPLRTLLLVAATAAAVLSLAHPVRAQMPGANNPAVQAALVSCKADREKFCASVSPGGGRIVRCLAERADALAPVCSKALSDLRASGMTIPR